MINLVWEIVINLFAHQTRQATQSACYSTLPYVSPHQHNIVVIKLQAADADIGRKQARSIEPVSAARRASMAS